MQYYFRKPNYMIYSNKAPQKNLQGRKLFLTNKFPETEFQTANGGYK